MAHMRLFSQVDPKIADLPPVSPKVPDVYHVPLNAKGGWDLSDIPPSGMLDDCSILRAQFIKICDMNADYSAEGPTTATDVIKYALCGLNTAG